MVQQIAVIFGGSGSIGSELASRYRDKGYEVVLAARNEENLRASAEEIGATAMLADATRSADVDAVFDRTVEQFGKVTIAVNCVGSILLKPAHLTSDEDWAETMNLNLTSSFYIVRAAVKTMRKTGGGAIALCSSAVHAIGLPNHEAISAAKAGVTGLVRAAAATYVSGKIRVNAVAPGLVDTNMGKIVTKSENSLKISLGMHPIGRIGKPQDIASALDWMTDPEQSWLTAQVINVEGGLASIKQH